MTREYEIVQIVSAPHGWRLVRSRFSVGQPTLSAPAEELMRVTPIICFALLEDEHGHREMGVIDIDGIPEPLFGIECAAGIVAILGPGEELTSAHHERAIEDILRLRLGLLDRADALRASKLAGEDAPLPEPFGKCGNGDDEECPCDPKANGDGTATCSVCGWTGAIPAGTYDELVGALRSYWQNADREQALGDRRPRDRRHE